MNEEEYSQVMAIKKAYDEEREKNSLLSKHVNNSMLNNNNEKNLIEYQLDLNDVLERIEHLLRGDELKFDGGGNLRYVEPDDDSLIVFNRYGVQEILRILQMYLNRNTILSNYDEETINFKVFDFGNRLVDLVFRKYEEMFHIPDYDKCKKIFMVRLEQGYYDLENYLDIEEIVQELRNIRHEILLDKIKLYEIIVGSIIDAVHSAYLRAYNGGERESLRTARMVSQSDNLNQQMMMPNMNNGQQNKFRWYNPNTWKR